MFFRLGVEHIADLSGYDHILFITSLCLTYVLKDWKKVLILITAFTIGHSVTLGLSVYNKIIIPTAWIEFLIPVTILITSVMNLFPGKQQANSHRPELLYVLTLFFGLIHGMGFSNYLKSLMGKTENIVTELFAFNVGLEAGQLMIVASVLLVSFIFVVWLKVKRQWWVTAVSFIAILMALEMCIDRFPL